LARSAASNIITITLVSVYYADGEKFGRVYTIRKATRFAERQRRSPLGKVRPGLPRYLIFFLPAADLGFRPAWAGKDVASGRVMHKETVVDASLL